jgi:hypothetical protein
VAERFVAVGQDCIWKVKRRVNQLMQVPMRCNNRTDPPFGCN